MAAHFWLLDQEILPTLSPDCLRGALRRLECRLLLVFRAVGKSRGVAGEDDGVVARLVGIAGICELSRPACQLSERTAVDDKSRVSLLFAAAVRCSCCAWKPLAVFDPPHPLHCILALLQKYPPS